MGRWDEFSVGWVKRVLFDAEAVTLENPREKGEFLVQTENRTQTLTPGAARGRLLGGNLTVLSAIIGSPYLPDWENSILFLEDVGEDLYRVDRMLTTLKLAGVLAKIRGFVFGTCSECEPGSGYGSLTMEEIFNDHIMPLEGPGLAGRDDRSPDAAVHAGGGFGSRNRRGGVQDQDVATGGHVMREPAP